MCSLLFSLPSERKEKVPAAALASPGAAAGRQLQSSAAPLPFREELKQREGCFPLGNLHFLMPREQENIYGQGLRQPTAQGGSSL